MQNVQRIKYACYATNAAMAVVGNLSPVLFLTFRSLYGISYSLLGLLVLVNFFTQLSIDLIFSFFSHKFNIHKTVKFTPVLTVIGLFIYAIFPFIFPNFVYLGLIIGTIVFSASGGLSEVLISPVIAALPSEQPERDLSKLHSTYAWGVVFVILFSTLFLFVFGAQTWQWLALIFTSIPIVACCLFSNVQLPKMETPEKMSGVMELLKNKQVWLCFFAIFLGGASECTMAQWSSSYLEQAMQIPKIWGDIFGVALFSAMLGLGRSLYGKYGKNIEKLLFVSAIGASACYLIAAVSNVSIIGLLACGLTGFCVSMMWPGSLMIGSERVPTGGVFIYAMMASGGDLGASIGPQLVGVIMDVIAESSFAPSLSQTLGLTLEQLGMKCGMLFGALFPLIGIFVFLHIFKTKKTK